MHNNLSLFIISYLMMTALLFPKSSALKLLTNKSFLKRVCMQQCSVSSTVNNIPKQTNELYKNFSFDILKQSKDSKARFATIKTPHGTIETPNFVFCATRGAMKALTPQQLRDEGTQIILSNTYHMMISPGADSVEKLGGLQKFTAWNGPMLTDSGGYQIFSMGHGSVASEIKGNRNNSMATEQLLLKIDEEGATFKSYVDGSHHVLTPEKSIELQRKLGADLIVVLDECTPFNVNMEYTLNSMRRSHRWAKRSLDEFKRTNTGKQALYGIVQGGIYQHMRDESTDFINNQEFFGTAIGGSLGNTRKGMHDIVAYTRHKVRDDRPVHLLGIGGVIDIFNGVRQGIDTFDCVSPMRLARHAGALVKASYWSEELHSDSILEAHDEAVKLATKRALKIQERKKQQQFSMDYINKTNQYKDKKDKNYKKMKEIPLEETDYFKEELEKQHNKINKKYSERIVTDHIKMKSRWMRCDPRPIDQNCSCYTCKNYSRGYLRHCFSNGELLGGTLVSIHNAHFMNKLMKDIREGIKNDNLDEVEREYVHPELRNRLMSEAVISPQEGDTNTTSTSVTTDNSTTAAISTTAPVSGTATNVTSTTPADTVYVSKDRNTTHNVNSKGTGKKGGKGLFAAKSSRTDAHFNE